MVCALMTRSRLLRLSLFVVALPLGLSCAAKPVPAEAPREPTPAPQPEESIASGDAISPIEAALAGSHREAGNRARDGQRHPQATLSFFGLTPQMTVVELWPGTGWYTEVLAATIQGHGKLITTNYDVNASTDPEDYRVRIGKAFAEKLLSDPIYEGTEAITVADPKSFTLAPEGSVDLVLTFRSSHGWVADGTAAAVFGEAFKALRPGGVLGVVQHRAKADDTRDPKVLAETGYVREDHLIEVIESVGFKLDEKSEINANAKDTKDYKEGVWTLPPVLALKEVEQAKYEAIGESDRMTLRFVKPD